MIWSIVSSVSSVVLPQLWHWYWLRWKMYFLTWGGMGMRGVLAINSFFNAEVAEGGAKVRRGFEERRRGLFWIGMRAVVEGF